MRLRLHKIHTGEWIGSVLRGNGGVSSLVSSSVSKSLWKTIKVFSFQNLIKAYKLDRQK